MQAFTRLSGPILVLEQENIDTDQIIPARFLTATDFDGIGEHLFADWRVDANGEQFAGHVLNQPRARHSPILVGGHNFGCGSSREHAPIALSHSGIKAVLALSFARIFYRNSVDGAFLLPIEIDEDAYKKISNGDELEIDTSKNEIKNLTNDQTYSMKPFSELIEKIIQAGGLFKFKPES